MWQKRYQFPLKYWRFQHEHFSSQFLSSFAVVHTLFQLNFLPDSASIIDVPSAMAIGHALLSI
ncbi:hypothetical protein RO3G_13815 [Rhizopus delemar RA 99-880]|uniref:Uncharacterized protein n=1 Tax=Rhizopus delemar (strain RA 99-880 / ATCC MYA-4621 / FGSC 9543 / NRRL 43880) TaxID=246409 RepID=I1CKX4_RHIO9|nr:hypothetical protein RO3G_13815 [Rhizopus delemar RA 99-880]|eukprot:EIE89104.1 hypothetical protein RO3G_13815 [Rhizopus delemar RA 99-880]